MWALGAILYTMIYGSPPTYSSNMLSFQKTLKKWPGIDKMQLYERGYSDELIDFLDRLLRSLWIERLTVEQAWRHPWLLKNRTKVNKIPRALAVESTLA